MKRILIVLMACLLIAACQNSKKKNAGSEPAVAVPEVPSVQDVEPVGVIPFKILTQEKLPQEVNLEADFSECSLAELVLLRNYVYAVHGCYFMEAEIERYFQHHTDWYYPMVLDLVWKKDLVLDYRSTRLTRKEQDFVGAIDRRIDELMEQAVQKETGLTDPRMVKTLWQFDDIDEDFMRHLSAHNFVIAQTEYEQLFNVYEENEYRQVGNFITTDLMLQLFHMYFVYAQKSVEKKVLTQKVKRLCQLMNQQASLLTACDDPETLHGPVLPAANLAAAYFSIPYALLTDSITGVPGSRELQSMEGKALGTTEDYNDVVRQELSLIQAQALEQSPLLTLDTYFPYDQFKPRGYYDRDEWSRRYFQAMQWLQLATLDYKNPQHLDAIVVMASILNSCPEALALYNDVNGAISFLTGEPDNLSVLDVANELRGSMAGADLAAEIGDGAAAAYRYIDQQMQNPARNRIRSKVANESDSVVNFMPARYTPDAQVLSRMADEKPNCERPFPRGLDVMCAFGSKTAERLITNFHQDPKAWPGWADEMARQKECFQDWLRTEAPKTVYNKWLATLISLQNETQPKLPPFMQTKAWDLKNTNTALASWAELKHDAILYAEQPILAECGGGGDLPEPYVKGYVEPNLNFWTYMQQLCTITRDKLRACGALPDELEAKLNSISDMVTKLQELSQKELEGKPLSEDDHWYIHRFGSSVEWMTLGLIDLDQNYSYWDEVKGPERSIACVADVFTRNLDGCRKCGIMHVATGPANAIYAIVRIGKYYYLTRGAVFSYREFVEPLGTRLTDEEWQLRLQKQPGYGMPQWMEPIMSGKQPKVDESIFYSSGC